eukprot:UN29089
MSPDTDGLVVLKRMISPRAISSDSDSSSDDDCISYPTCNHETEPELKSTSTIDELKSEEEFEEHSINSNNLSDTNNMSPPIGITLSPKNRCLIRADTDLPSTLMRLKTNESHPLDNSQSNKLEEQRNNRKIWVEIIKDVERTLQTRVEFQDLKIKYLLCNILWIWSKEYPEWGYEQGMNDLVSIIVVALSQDCDEVDKITKEQDILKLKTLFQPQYLEHDAYGLFQLLMEYMKGYYFKPALADLEQDPGGLCSRKSNNSLSKRLWHLHHRVLRYVDYEVYDHLETHQIAPHSYLMRWIRLLLCREFQPLDVLKIWDCIFRDPEDLNFDLICVGIILEKRKQILKTTGMSICAILQDNDKEWIHLIDVDKLCETTVIKIRDIWYRGNRCSCSFSKKELIEVDEQFFTKNDTMSWPSTCIPESDINKRKSLEYF